MKLRIKKTEMIEPSSDELVGKSFVFSGYRDKEVLHDDVDMEEVKKVFQNIKMINAKVVDVSMLIFWNNIIEYSNICQ